MPDEPWSWFRRSVGTGVPPAAAAEESRSPGTAQRGADRLRHARRWRPVRSPAYC